jgi:hypothetical protein
MKDVNVLTFEEVDVFCGRLDAYFGAWRLLFRSCFLKLLQMCSCLTVHCIKNTVAKMLTSV